MQTRRVKGPESETLLAVLCRRLQIDPTAPQVTPRRDPGSSVAYASSVASACTHDVCVCALFIDRSVMLSLLVSSLSV